MTETFVAIDKPANFVTHPPTTANAYYSPKYDALRILKRQIDQNLYPVHRLDRETSGILVYALDPATAKELNLQFSKHEIEKKYLAVVRGWVEEKIEIKTALESDQKKDSLLPAHTIIEPLAKIELPYATKRYEKSRYTLLIVTPITGKFHQIRRHCKSIGHPIVGDKKHGDSLHNRFFKENLKITGLLLRSQKITFAINENKVTVSGRYKHLWHQVFNLFGICPYLGN